MFSLQVLSGVKLNVWILHSTKNKSMMYFSKADLTHPSGAFGFAQALGRLDSCVLRVLLGARFEAGRGRGWVKWFMVARLYRLKFWTALVRKQLPLLALCHTPVTCFFMQWSNRGKKKLDQASRCYYYPWRPLTVGTWVTRTGVNTLQTVRVFLSPTALGCWWWTHLGLGPCASRIPFHWREMARTDWWRSTVVIKWVWNESEEITKQDLRKGRKRLGHGNIGPGELILRVFVIIMQTYLNNHSL